MKSCQSLAIPLMRKIELYIELCNNKNLWRESGGRQCVDYADVHIESHPANDTDWLKRNIIQLLQAHHAERYIESLMGRNLRDLASTGGVSNPQESSPILEPINFPTDSIDDTIPSAVTAVALLLFSLLFFIAAFSWWTTVLCQKHTARKWKEGFTAFIPFLNISLYP